jgi:6-phosphogluconolactonase (cycloisomerase 2 family)
VSPDGGHLYVTNQNTPEISVYAIAQDGTLSADGTTASGGSTPFGVIVSPDGKFLFVADQGSAKVAVFSIASDGSLTAVAGSPFDGPSNASFLALTPDGKYLYASGVSPNVVAAFSVGSDGSLTQVSGSPFSAGSQPQGVAVTPDGRFLYVTNEIASGSVTAFSIASDGSLTAVSGSPFAAGDFPIELAAAPDQGPSAAFKATPGYAGHKSSFDASGSSDADGTVARYDWSFGDGTTAADGGAKPTHVYAAPGKYTVRLTVTDDSGCSTTQVFTGQTAYCNGGPAATTTKTVEVSRAPRPRLAALRVRPASFLVAKRNGVRVSYRDSLPAEATLTVFRCLGSGGQCGRRSRLGSFTHLDRAGANALRLPRGIARRLAPGSYDVVATAALAGRRSRPVRTAFDVVRPAPACDPDHDGDCGSPLG